MIRPAYLENTMDCVDCGTDSGVCDDWELEDGAPLCLDCYEARRDGLPVPQEWEIDPE